MTTKPWKVAIKMWRARGRFGLTLPMLAAITLKAKGRSVDVDSAKQEAVRVFNDMLRHPRINGTRLVRRFFCHGTQAWVFGWSHKTTRMPNVGTAIRSYPWTALSRNFNRNTGAYVWGNIHGRDKRFMRDVIKEINRRKNGTLH